MGPGDREFEVGVKLKLVSEVGVKLEVGELVSDLRNLRNYKVSSSFRFFSQPNFDVRQGFETFALV